MMCLDQSISMLVHLIMYLYTVTLVDWVFMDELHAEFSFSVALPSTVC